MKVVDLTLTIHEGMPCFPVSWYPSPKFEDILHVDNDPTGSHRYASKALLFSHGGTHLDSPKHYAYFDCKETIDIVPVDTLVNDCVWVHFPDKKNLEAITADDLEKACAGKSVKGKSLLITTGYTDKNWEVADDYFQVSPFLGVDAAKWMVANEIKLVAIDFQTDRPGDASFPVHNELLSHKIYIQEYITNVNGLIEAEIGDEFILSIGALKLKDLEASTCRVFAIKV